MYNVICKFKKNLTIQEIETMQDFNPLLTVVDAWCGLKVQVCAADTNILIITNLQDIPVFATRMCVDGPVYYIKSSRSTSVFR